MTASFDPQSLHRAAADVTAAMDKLRAAPAPALVDEHTTGHAGLAAALNSFMTSQQRTVDTLIADGTQHAEHLSASAQEYARTEDENQEQLDRTDTP